MSSPAYHRLARRLDKPPLRTVFNDVLLEMLALLFTEEEALLVSQMPGKRSTAANVAELANRPEGEVAPILDSLSSRGLLFSSDGDDGRTYLLLPLMPGIFEVVMCVAPDSPKTKRFAELFHEYYSPEYLDHMLKRPARMFKIIPIEESVTNHSGVLPSDQIREAIDRHDTWSLAHFCACCCVAMQALNSFNAPAMFTNGRYIAGLDEEACTACGDCADACHVGALQVYENRLIAKPARCIGCGVCASKCEVDAIEMVLRPDNRPIPKNYGEMVLDVTTETMGIQKYTDAIEPAFSKMLGGLFQKGLRQL